MMIFNTFDGVEFDPSFVFDSGDLKQFFNDLKKFHVIPQKYSQGFQANQEQMDKHLDELIRDLLPYDLYDYEQEGDLDDLHVDNDFDSHVLLNDVVNAIVNEILIKKTTSFDSLLGTNDLVDKYINSQVSYLSECTPQLYDDPCDDYLYDLDDINPDLTKTVISRLRKITNNQLYLETHLFIPDKKYLIYRKSKKDLHFSSDRLGYSLPEDVDGSIGALDFDEIGSTEEDPNDPKAFADGLKDLIHKTFTPAEIKILALINTGEGEDDCYDDGDYQEPDSSMNIVGIEIYPTDMNDKEFNAFLDKLESFYNQIAYEESCPGNHEDDNFIISFDTDEVTRKFW